MLPVPPSTLIDLQTLSHTSLPLSLSLSLSLPLLQLILPPLLTSSTSTPTPTPSTPPTPSPLDLPPSIPPSSSSSSSASTPSLLGDYPRQSHHRDHPTVIIIIINSGSPFPGSDDGHWFHPQTGQEAPRLLTHAPTNPVGGLKSASQQPSIAPLHPESSFLECSWTPCLICPVADQHQHHHHHHHQPPFPPLPRLLHRCHPPFTSLPPPSVSFVDSSLRSPRSRFLRPFHTSVRVSDGAALQPAA
ncbi:hypothetical protein BO70DRAFT_100869 [Aspergillus heteromorphus CBS 117.55]|uniref:Uncharacterized protein n=1 Tax=Aspergillus heteromorphus CBS 117.55 TaxID=1448321 RepID=A0A317VQB7_9EURO|nr:uncharacterized protein BO70DRAFT_100869 [Aspergillus heteromorphus CBS 117.55]PWY75082.1 hypothetical protein BO70DRAFT_100869 [Aspergillus heteromorphus CBS 117.55]